MTTEMTSPGTALGLEGTEPGTLLGEAHSIVSLDLPRLSHVRLQVPAAQDAHLPWFSGLLPSVGASSSPVSLKAGLGGRKSSRDLPSAQTSPFPSSESSPDLGKGTGW